jgi:hypothetical protein
MSPLHNHSTDRLMDSVQRHANGNYWLGLITGAAAVALISIAIHKLTAQPASAVDMPKDVITAYNLGIKDALKTNPPSAALEYACLELWANKQ